jgi:intergrase/recombinase
MARMRIAALVAAAALAGCGDDDVGKAVDEIEQEGRQTLRDLDRAIDKKDERKIEKAKRELNQQIDELEQEGSETAKDLKRELKDLERDDER